MTYMTAGRQWHEQGGWWSERQRSRGLYWPAGDTWFVNDPLGPMPHSHPDATEVFLVASGELSLTVGRDVHELSAGALVLVPPGTYHEPFARDGSELCLLAVVAPNWRDARWITEGFGEEAFAGKARIAQLHMPGELPSDDNLRNELHTVGPRETGKWRTDPDRDILIYSLSDAVHVDVGHLSGDVGRNDYVNVMAGTPYRVGNPTESVATYLTISAGTEAPVLAADPQRGK